MDNIRFYNTFRFITLSFKGERYTDASDGIQCHFIGRMHTGRARIRPNTGEELILTPGDVFYFPLGLRYQSYWYPDEDTQSVEWESYRFTLFPCAEGKSYALQKLFPNEQTLQYLDRLDNDKRISATSVGNLYIFLGGVLPEMQEVTPDRRESFLTKASAYIAAHREFSVPDLARYMGMSESGLYAFFASYAHTTPVELKNRIRAEEAIRLLGSTDLSVEEISDRVGFQSVAYFRKILKKHTNKTPGEIRKEQFSKYNL